MVPTVSTDVFVLIAIEFIASKQESKGFREVIEAHSFSPVAPINTGNFSKITGPGLDVVLDLHAPTESLKRVAVRADDVRVKPKSSQSGLGVHAHANPEAIALDETFAFERNGVGLEIPNMLSLAIMRLVAASDRFKAARQAIVPKRGGKPRSMPGTLIGLLR
jgi:hypothetical protein